MNTTNTREDADTDRTHLLQNWTVRYSHGNEALLFHCQAENAVHSIEQCQNAYPCNNVVSASLDALTGTNTIVVALPKAFQLMVDGTPQSGPWFILVDKTTGELVPDLMVGDVAFYASYDEARAALDFNLAEYAKESALTDQQSQGSPSTSNNDAKRARITAAGYTIQSHNIGTNMEGWWALVPGETKFHIEEDGNQNYLGFFSNEQDLLDQIDGDLADKASTARALYKDEAGYTVEIVDMDTETVTFARQGGGFLHSMARQEFDSKFKPASVPEFQKTWVTSDWFPDGMKLQAYSQGLRWNGWVMPWFELDAAKTLLEHIPELRWNADGDLFKLVGGEDHEIWSGKDVQVGDQTLRLYPIGAGSWCWDGVHKDSNLAELGKLDAGERAAIGTEAASLPVEEPFSPQTLGDLINSMPLWRNVEWDQEVLSMSTESNCGKDCADVLTKGHALALLCRDVDTALITAVVSQVNIFVFG